MLGPSPLATRASNCPVAMRRNCDAAGGGGSGLQAPGEIPPLTSPDYYVRVGQLLRALRDCEKKRLDLEDKLYEYNKSAKCRAALKCAKLRKNLKEIYESERRAHVRNQGYLKQFEQVQTHIESFATNREKLQKLKTEYETRIKMTHLLSKDALRMKGELKNEDREKERLSPENRTTDLKCDSSSRSEGSNGEILTREHIEVEEERASQRAVSTISVSEHCASENKWSQEKHATWEGFSDDLSHGDPNSQKPFLKMQDEQEEASSCSSSDLTVSVSEDDLILENLEPLPNPLAKMEGEDRIQASRSINPRQQRDVLLTDYVLKTQAIPDSKRESSIDSARESEQEPDWGLLTQAQHVKEHDNSLKEEATALLKKALIEECDHRSAIHSNESSCSLPSILNDNGGIKKAKPTLRLSSVLPWEQEFSSGFGNESKEESMATATPVTETKAYQFLKKCMLQDNSNQIEEKFQSQFSSLNIGSSTFKTKTAHRIAWEASFSSREGSPLSRPKSRENPMTNLKSDAFSDESDESNSEIEAALRPKDRNT